MAVADLSLALNVQSSGTAEIDKLISALNKYSDKVDQIRNQKPPEAAPWEKFGQDVKNAIENPLQAAGNAAKGLLDKLGPVGTGVALFGGAAIAAGVATVNIARQMGDLGLSIQNTALRMGLSTKEVGQFTYRGQARRRGHRLARRRHAQAFVGPGRFRRRWREGPARSGRARRVRAGCQWGDSIDQ